MKLLLLGRKKRFEVFVRFLEPVSRALLISRLGRYHRRVEEQPGILGSFRERPFHFALGFIRFAGHGQRPCQRIVRENIGAFLEFPLSQKDRLWQ